MKEIKRIKKELVTYGKIIMDKGLAVGPGGNISARCGEVVYLSPTGYSLGDLVEEDYVGVSLKTGEIVDGHLKPTCEVSMHLGCYSVRDDVQAVVHVHPPLATGVVSAGVKIKPMFPDFVVLLGELPVIDYVIPAGGEIRKAVTAVINDHDAVLLVNHGAVTVGASLKEAFHRAELIENAARTLIASLTVGNPRFLTEEEIKGIKNLEAEDYRKALLKGKNSTIQ